LFAPLLRSLPPIPAPDAQNQLSLKAAFLSQASSLFTDSSSKPEGNSKAAEASRIHDSHSKIIHFLRLEFEFEKLNRNIMQPNFSYQPFLNLILACASDDGFGFLDGFLDQLHTYLKSLVNKVIKVKTSSII
jgi:hypothetical protein